MAKGIITLCGSTRFKQQFNDANFWLTMNGYIVLSVGSFLHSDSDPEIRDVIRQHKDDLDKLHRDKIRLSDAIMVIDVQLGEPYSPDGYVGESTRGEIEFALERQMPVYSYRRTKELEFKRLSTVLPSVLNEWINPQPLTENT